MWPSCVGRTLVMSLAVWFSLCSATARVLRNEWFGSRQAVQMRYRWNTDEKDLPLLEMDGDGRLEEAEVAGFGDRGLVSQREGGYQKLRPLADGRSALQVIR